MVFRLPSDTVMTTELLSKLIKKHEHEVQHRYLKLKEAYESDLEIFHQAPKPKWKPDNRIGVNFPKYCVDTMNGFFIGNPIKVTCDDENISAFLEKFDQYNNQDDKNAELAKICSIYGTGYELYYTDEQSELCSVYLTPIEAFMVFDDSVIERPMFFVRLYTDWEGKRFGTISDSETVRRFAIPGPVEWTSEPEPHYFPGVPAVEYQENNERQGIFEPVLSMVNAYNKALSEKANDVDYFADAYMKVLGSPLDNTQLKNMRDSRIINFDGNGLEKPEVDFLAKPNSDTTQENLLERLERLIFQISMVANISDENFGASSGIALKYKLFAMSNLEKVKERKFAAGMTRRYRLLFGHPSSRVSPDDWTKVKMTFTPNFPANVLEEAQIAAQLEGLISKETQLKELSIVDDVKAEMERMEAEEEGEPDILPSFGASGEAADGAE